MASRPEPDLRTARLRLSVFTADDVDALTGLLGDADVRRYLSVGDLTRDDARRFATEFVRQTADEMREAGYAALAVRRGDGGQALGYCGLRPLPDRITAAELVYALSPPYWHQGLTREAVAAVLEWAESLQGLKEVLSMTRPEHRRSRAVMAACGLTYAGETSRYYGETLALYRLRLTPS